MQHWRSFFMVLTAWNFVQFCSCRKTFVQHPVGRSTMEEVVEEFLLDFQAAFSVAIRSCFLLLLLRVDETMVALVFGWPFGGCQHGGCWWIIQVFLMVFPHLAGHHGWKILEDPRSQWKTKGNSIKNHDKWLEINHGWMSMEKFIAEFLWYPLGVLTR